jgi:hypothetical protein
MHHALDARAEAQGACLLKGDGLSMGNADTSWSGHRAKAIGEQLAPRIISEIWS